MKYSLLLSILVTFVFFVAGCKRDSNQVKGTLSAAAPMVLVEGGTFNMGEKGNATSPLHQVTVSSYYISKTEVTQGQWKSVMGSNQSYFSVLGDNGPVEQVNWYDCIKFCNKLSVKEGKTPVYSVNGKINPDSWPIDTASLNHPVRDMSAKGYRLPTEAEWEYAAKGGNRSSNYKHSGSNNVDSVAWYNSNSNYITHIVATKKANELGISDMSGNVAEWCWDLYGIYTSDSQTNPVGASSGNSRLVRGGCWVNYSFFCRVPVRLSDPPDYRNFLCGFRVAGDS